VELLGVSGIGGEWGWQSRVGIGKRGNEVGTEKERERGKRWRRGERRVSMMG
jgi:hypothetical protein